VSQYNSDLNLVKRVNLQVCEEAGFRFHRFPRIHQGCTFGVYKHRTSGDAYIEYPDGSLVYISEDTYKKLVRPQKSRIPSRKRKSCN